VAGIAIFPLRVDVGGIDEVTVVFCVGVEDGEGLGLVGAPAKYISTEAEWVDFKVGLIEGDMSHAEKFMALE
jgi:hypothetical protein